MICNTNQIGGVGVFADVGELKQQIIARDDRNFVSRYVFDSIPHIFGGDLDAWIEWKSDLGSKIDVDARDIVLTGSAALGYSLNPQKAFNTFHNESDIDCGIISNHYFNISWRFLRQRRVEWLTLGKSVKDAISMHRDNYVFSGTIATDRILGLLPFGQAWAKALDHMATRPPTYGRDIKLRIYKDFDCLRGYQSVGIRKARNVVNVGSEALEHGIPTEAE